jgi:hypothetical protein
LLFFPTYVHRRIVIERWYKFFRFSIFYAVFSDFLDDIKTFSSIPNN